MSRIQLLTHSRTLGLMGGNLIVAASSLQPGTITQPIDVDVLAILGEALGTGTIR